MRLVADDEIERLHAFDSLHEREHGGHDDVRRRHAAIPAGHHRMRHADLLQGGTDLLQQFAAVGHDQDALVVPGHAGGDV